MGERSPAASPLRLPVAGAQVAPEGGETGDAPSASTVRKLTLLVRLMRQGRVRMEQFVEEFGTSERSFKRDLKHVRELAGEAGFTISPVREGAVTMAAQSGGLALQVDQARRDLDQLLETLAKVLGEPVGRRLPRGKRRDDAAPATMARRFLHFAFPELIGDRWVADVYDALEQIWSKGAYARFKYPKHGGRGGTERFVEPHAVIARSGRYYLIAYDRDAKGWRYFALDQIISKPQAAGTVAARRELPAYIRPDDCIGMIIGDAKTKRIDVSVELSVKIARSVVSRRWQHDQIATMEPDGTGRITFHVPDVEEVVRWAFGFGDAARVVAPPEAVAIAARMLDQMRRSIRSGAPAP
ncbi:MAG: WYL domain-containing protein [bacterium]|nr:WYL domain-containing protein [bacterium]